MGRATASHRSSADGPASHVSRTLNEKPVDPELLDEMLSIYYGMMAWDLQTGEPTEAKLHELDIARAAEMTPPRRLVMLWWRELDELAAMIEERRTWPSRELAALLEET